MGILGIIGTLFVAGIIVAAMFSVVAVIIMVGWNFVFGSIYHLSFLQALVLFIICSMLFRGGK